MSHLRTTGLLRHLVPRNDIDVTSYLSVSSVQRILVIKLKHIGDVLLATPVFEMLHGHYPQAKISALVPRGTEEMLENNPFLSETLVFDRAVKRFHRTSLMQAEWDLIRALRARRFDLVIDLSGGDRGAILAFCSGAPMRLGYRRRKGLLGRDRLFTQTVANDFKKNVMDSHADVLRLLGMEGPVPPPRLWPTHEAGEQARLLLERMRVGPGEPLVVFHPTSRWMFKSWEAGHCARLADILVKKWECRVAFTCGPEEKELKKMRQILALTREPVLDLSGKTTLSVLAALIANAKAFVGVDSAPLHMAVALDIPALALFGPSDPVQWGPLGAQHRLVTKRWACQPCQRDGCLGSKVSQCLTDLGVEEVSEVLDDWLPGILRPVLSGRIAP